MYQDPNFDKELYWKQRNGDPKAIRYMRRLRKTSNVVKSHPSGIVPHTSNKGATKKAIMHNGKRHRKELARLGPVL